MVRRRTRRGSRPAARWLPWTPAMAELFRLGCLGDWSPPAEVRLSGGHWRQTLSARFTDSAGVVMTAKIRLVRDPASLERHIVGEELSIPLGRIGPGAER